MRALSTLSTILASTLAVGCGGSGALLAPPPPMELSFLVTLHPEAADGMRPSTLVSATLVENDVVKGVLRSAEFRVLDAQGGLLARETVEGPVTFEADHTLTIHRVLDWTPADVLGRRLVVTFVVGPAGAAPTVIQRTVTF